MNKAIGAVELSSIAKGMEVCDLMLKTSPVELLLSRTICPGKYLVLVSGSVANVNSAVEAGITRGAHAVADSFVIPNVDESVFPAFFGTFEIGEEGEALGVIETFSISAAVTAADSAVKAANIKLLEIRLAMALGGKAYVTFTGSVAAVETAVAVGIREAGKKGLLVDGVAITNPRAELFREMM